MSDGNFLTRMLSGGSQPQSATEAPLGSGLADMARAKILQKQYQDHVAMATQTGDEPMTYEEFIRSKTSGGQNGK